MKISAKLFLLIFSVITFISATSAFIYHSLAQKLLQTQQAKALVNSANDFIFTFQDLIQKIDEDYQNYSKIGKSLKGKSYLEFVFEVKENSIISESSFKIKSGAKVYTNVSSLDEFLKYNTNVITRRLKKGNAEIYYGKRIDSKLVKSLSEKIRAEVALVEGDVVTKFTTNEEGNYYLPYLSKVSRELKNINNFEIINESIDNVDFSATHYSPKTSVIYNNNIDFIIYSISDEASSFKDTMNLVTALIVISGIFLSVIFLFLFTAKLRKQLEFINLGVTNISAGKIKERVKIISKDEIGNLGVAFNQMLDDIEKRDQSEKDYAEFISLIIQNPSLEEIGNATLNKIVNMSSVDVGALYLYEDGELNPFAAIGLPSKKININEESSFYSKAIDKKEIVEIQFEKNHPLLKTGITELKISYLYVLPIFYNNKIIAVLELASVNKPKVDIKNYLLKIQNQLAIGLANGKALYELKTLVDELQNLNSAYQEQNIKITAQNEELLKLHEKLKSGSKELEIQTTKAIESEKIKSQFLANMSHELRTPQNSILGLTELILKDSSTPTKTKERLNVVLRNGKKLLTLIENILEYSKLESGKTEIKKSKLKLSELLNEVTSYISPLFLEREIKFLLNVKQQNDFEIETDIKKVEQIIYNLIGNASKFTKEGYVKLELEVLGQNLMIRVEDTGPGISEDDKKIIFTEFRQADANLNRKYSGTGLGLAICKRYSDLLNGSIEVTSELEKGSIFSVSLPNVVVSSYETPIQTYMIESSTDKLNALIISDGNDAVDLISDYLNSNNIGVSVRQSYQLNDSTIEEIKPDLIVIDILFEELNGWQLLTNIKEHPSSSDIPLIVVNMDEEANCGLGINVYKYYSDDFSKIKINQAIEHIEEQQSIKFRKLLFIASDERYSKLENDLIEYELKIYHHNGKGSAVDFIKKYEPELIFIDMYDPSIEPIRILTELNNDIYSKNIPVISFTKVANEDDRERLNNDFIETTLQNQYHPLDVLKIIKDRIELIDSSIFNDEKQISNIEKPSIPENTNKAVDGKIKILVVDDDDDARFTIGEIVESLGYNPSFATNGFECLDMLEEEMPDLVLLDIMMPKMDGFQTIKKIRGNENYSQLNVHALTAYAMLKDKEIIEKNGFNGLFTKPINTIQLERKLNQIFKTI